MTTTVRFAPSPTGNIHIGNLRVAIYNWLLAKSSNGQFILRFDDTDKDRSKQEYADGIAHDLEWIGITPDRIEYQSKRTDRYDQVAQDLKNRGLLYPCYETADELDRKRKRLRSRGLPPVYDRTGYRQTESERKNLENSGRKPHWRFLLPNFTYEPNEPVPTHVEWDDLCRGNQSVDLSSISDPVLIREDGTYLYTLPSIIDDIDMEISHVVRGEDHVANTGVQISIFEEICGKPPQFAHHNLLVMADGGGLSKRSESLSIRELRNQGFEALTLAAMSGLLGTSHPVEPIASLDDLANTFEFKKISRAPARFDLAELNLLNQKLLHVMPYELAQERLASLNEDHGMEFWEIVRANINRFHEVKEWSRVVFGTIDPRIDTADSEFIQNAAQLLPPEPWDESTWHYWTESVKEKTGRRGRSLFMPLRKALTGLEHGPELKRMLPLIGYERTLLRLSNTNFS